MSKKVKIRFKVKNPWQYGWPCWEIWREREVEPERISITIMPSSLCYGLSERHGGVQVHLPEQEHIWICFEDDDEYEIEDFATPDMGDETYLSLYQERCG